MFLYSLGFGLAVSWLWLFYLQGPLLAPICNAWSISPEILFRSFIGSLWVTCFILCKIFKIATVRNKKTLLVPCVLLLSLTPLLTAILPLIFPQYIYPPLAIIFAVLSGIALAFFHIAWMETISLHNLRKSSVMFGLAVTLASSLTLLGAAVDYYCFLPFLALSLPVSLLLMWRKIPEESSLLSEYHRINLVRPFPLKLAALISTIYMAGGTIFNIISIDQSYSNMFFITNISYSLFCLLAGLILYHYENFDLRIMYQTILSLLFIGFMIFGFQNGSLMTITAFLLLQGGLALIDMYTWLLFPYFSRFSTRPAAVCAYGLLITTFSVFGGNIIVDILASLLAEGHNEKNIAFIAGIAAIITIFLFPSKKETFSGWQALLEPKSQSLSLEKQQISPIGIAVSHQEKESPEVPDEERPSPLKQTITTDLLPALDGLSLSYREKEVLILLLKGRNGRIISESLNISSNTVKFHIRNIYSKLAVSNRQELLSVFERKSNP